MNASTAGRDPADLERESSEIRADMDRTLDALERKLSPAQLLDRALHYLQENREDLTRVVGDTLRRNPVPVIVSVAGLAWLITSSIVSRTHAVSGGEPNPTRRGPIDERVAATRERIHASRSAAANKISGAMEATRVRTQRVQDSVYSLVDEQPLALGALAVIIGAIVGASIPTTQYENRTMGQARDRAFARAKQMGERQYQNLRSKLEIH